MSACPSTVFKYEGFNVLSLQNLKAQSFYFASPRQFNDPYDCAITAGLSEPDDEGLEAVRLYYLNRPNTSENAKAEMAAMSRDSLKVFLIGIARDVFHREKIRFLSENGICCFSERNDDLLMWSHYGGRHRGFCLEFRTQFEPFDKLRIVKYADEMPQLHIQPFIVDRDASQLIQLYCTKAKDWAYEREWRVIHKQVGTLFTYPATSLKAVYFGPDIDRHAMEIICLILGGQNSEVEYWRGKRSETKFKVEFEPFTYTPFLKAKELGLIEESTKSPNHKPNTR